MLTQGRAAILCATGAALGLGAEALAYDGQGLDQAAADLAVGWTLIGAGLWSGWRAPQSAAGPLLAAAGSAWFLGTFAAGARGALGSVGAATLFLHRGPLIHLVATQPRLRPIAWPQGVLVVVGYLYAALPSIARNPWATLVVAGLVVALAGLRPRRGRMGAHLDARSALAAPALLAIALVITTLPRLAGVGAGGGRDAVLLGYEAALVGFACAVASAVTRAAIARARVADLVVELGEPSRSANVREALAASLGDDSLQIGYWLSDRGAYVDEDGRTLEFPEEDPARAVTLLRHEGTQIAALVHDPLVLDDRRLVDAVSRAAALGAENARLRAEVRAQATELSDSRRRIVDAADAQRRRLETRLHEGAARRLDGLAARLGHLRTRVSAVAAPSFAELVEEAATTLEEARGDLSELARGIHPRVLTEDGLAAALRGLAGRAPLTVSVRAPDERFPPAVESAIYFVCAESLVNVAKYSRASRCEVEVSRADRWLSVEVADDGVGGANRARGSGLRGLADRVEALGGRFRVWSPPGEGTRVVARLPLN